MGMYKVDFIRRRSKNNGINFCRYWVIINTETKNIVYDTDLIISKHENLNKALNICEEYNKGLRIED